MLTLSVLYIPSSRQNASQQIFLSSSLDPLIKDLARNVCVKLIERIHTQFHIQLKNISEKVSNRIIRLAAMQEHKLDMSSSEKDGNHLMIDLIDCSQIHLIIDEGVLVDQVQGRMEDEVVLAGDGVGCWGRGCGEFCGVERFIASYDEEKEW